MSFIDNIFKFTDKLLGNTPQQVIRISREDYLWSISSNFVHYLYLKHWKYVSNNQKQTLLITSSLSLVSLYILAPTFIQLFQSQETIDKMFSSKRQDKFTTGLINTRNDCFANSSIQAFAALPGLDVYLNDILKQYKLLTKLPINSKGLELPQLPLHEALAKIVYELQETILQEHYVSVWPFLQVIEKIFNSKISTNQNDAHELVQLILETLDNENTKFKRFVKNNNLNFVIPELPFNGLLADQLTCLSCLNSSKPSFHPFAVLSLAVPQGPYITLQEMMKKNEVETINGYNCLRCKISAILKVERENQTNHDPSLVSRLIKKENKISINDDLPEELSKFISNYSYNGFVTEKLQSTIVKKTLVVRAPKLLTVHLSRSMFTGTQVTRNGCRVGFEDVLAVNVDEVLNKAYHKKQKIAKKLKKQPSVINETVIKKVEQDDDDDDEDDDDENDADDDDDGEDEEDEDIDGYDEDRNEPQQLARIHSKVLTQHEESVSETGESENTTTTTTNQDQFSQNSQTQSDNTSPDTDEHPNSDDENNQDVADDDSDSDIEDHELNASKETVKFRLRAMIRHTGTHNAGHYECYRHKPAFVKDMQTDSIVNASPLINFGEDIPTSEQTPEVVVAPNEEPLEVPTSPATNGASLNGNSPNGGNTGGISRRRSTRLRRLSEIPPTTSLSPNGNANGQGGDVSRSSITDNEDATTTDNEDGSHFSRFRSKLGSFVSRSRRPSISMSSTSNVGSRRGSVANIAQPMSQTNSISNTSAPLSELQEGFQELQLSSEANSRKHNKRFKKISTVAKFPFWRISDTRVQEVKKFDVLKETQAVYMIYYERV
ncbi:Ubiquitin carboxyl-terminal hydrolase [Wickerhamomyces ciferrii]|uniref:Ubiquitin carboxyl-terminal hydrolase n=1 Tax=Wickerhamomyces ciferrii (strain ATCC 14091 / BCRC 22168 / CBS 111 / JCM 3599 / NBRC 0793 / NRRL Y-1031 F-60-10) TaxID=1206466 RepID=K0KNU9_WICCF|nr:Ubiquitin carboxyl-terminal hydrolase [Wickerhamomyces ciferrii]CCH43079.1 Ubiquitin carboxyl-terminal hydrolase [Wickerhamomyces ciferrii]